MVIYYKKLVKRVVSPETTHMTKHVKESLIHKKLKDFKKKYGKALKRLAE